MSDRKNVNKYYPPDWDPSKGSLNQYHGQHPLRERANKLHLGILVIRFEMPFNIWCTSCNAHIGKGVRYNAEKKKVGMYHSTAIYEFTMNCHLCGKHIVVRTDPANTDYLVVSGGRRKIETYDASEEESQVHTLPSDDEKKRLITDPIFRLEVTDADKLKATERKERVEELTDLQQRMADDYAQNQAARKKFRTEKKHLASLTAESTARGFHYHLLPTSDADKDEASSITFATPATADTIQRVIGKHGPTNQIITAKTVDEINRIKIKAGSIFGTTFTPAISTSKHAAAASSRLAALIQTTARGVAKSSLQPLTAAADDQSKKSATTSTSASSPALPVAIKRKRSDGSEKDDNINTSDNNNINTNDTNNTNNNNNSARKARKGAPNQSDANQIIAIPTDIDTTTASTSAAESALVSSAYDSDG